MGFTIETRPGPAIAIKAGRNDRTPVFVAIAELAAAKGSDRAKYLKEKAGRNFALRQGREGADRRGGQTAVLSALSAVVDERGSRAANSRRWERRCCSRPTNAGAPAVITHRAP